MKKLPGGIEHNTAEEYDRIFREREQKGMNWSDKRRWKKLLRYYNHANEWKLLDLGCLDSGIPHMMYQKNYWGLDVASGSISAMSEKNPFAHYKVGNLYQTDFPSGKFDYVVLGEVLEHLERPAHAVREAFRVLRSDGILAVSVPLEEALEPGAVDIHRHLLSYSEEDILNLVEPYSLKTKTKILRSQWFPRYRYSWPTLIVWAWKK